KDRTQLKTQLDTVVAATSYDLKNIKAMPLIEGKVLAVEMGVEPGLVSINCGESAKVQRGFTFELFQGNTYKGQARVEYVYPDMCSAVLVRKVKGETIPWATAPRPVCDPLRSPTPWHAALPSPPR